MIRNAWTLLAAGTSLAATGFAANAALSAFFLRKPGESVITDTVSVLLPVRNEIDTVTRCVESILAQDAIDELIIYDDASTDGTGELVKALAHSDSRVSIASAPPGSSPPPNWFGKTWACHQMSKLASGTVMVFIDADVVLEPGAIGSAVSLLRHQRFDLVSPYPRQLADGMLPRLIQPLLQWSWMSFVPLRISEYAQPPSMAVANGQFLVIDANQYDRVGGHASVAHQVVEDVALARVIRRSGGRTAVVDGTHIATCRMYNSASGLVDGYAKSLWTAFRKSRSAAATVSALLLIYVIPPVALVIGPTARTRKWGLLGYSAAVASRIVVARRTGQRVIPDVFSQPLSVLALAGIAAISLQRKRSDQLSWKGRSLAG